MSCGSRPARFGFVLRKSQEFCGEYNDATLVVLLATLTKACVSLPLCRLAGRSHCVVSGLCQHL